MTVAEALATAPNTEAFEDAVEAMSYLAEIGNRDASRALSVMLQRNEDFLIRAMY